MTFIFQRSSYYSKQVLSRNKIPYTKEAFLEVISNRDEKMAKHFINIGMDVNHTNGLPLITASLQDKNSAIIELLLNHKANINVESPDSHTPLIYSCIGGFMDNVNILLEYGSDINLSNNEGITPLMFASINGRKEVVTLLLENEASINIEDSYGKTALWYAIEKNEYHITEILLKNGAKITKSISKLALKQNNNQVLYLLDEYIE
jgi:ankyrin repeat protein